MSILIYACAGSSTLVRQSFAYETNELYEPQLAALYIDTHCITDSTTELSTAEQYYVSIDRVIWLVSFDYSGINSV